MNTVEEMRKEQYRKFLVDSGGDTISQREFENLIRSPGVMNKNIVALGGLKRALLLQAAGARI